MPRPLRLADARALIHDGYPAVDLLIEGWPVRLIWECKAQILDVGLVHVGEGLADELPELIPNQPFLNQEGRLHTLRGFSADRRLLALYRGFLRSLSADGDAGFRPGPIPIPD